MPQVDLEGLSESLSRLPSVIQSIPDILRNPAANPLQAVILLGIGLVLALILVVSLLLVLMRPTAEEEELLAQDSSLGEAEFLSEEERADLERKDAVNRRMTGLTVTSIIILIWAAVWLVSGVTTSRSDVCTSCHTNTTHAAAKKEDPHANVACVDCHEGGGAFARISVNVFTRIEHVALARINTEAAAAYGKPVASDACFRCHRQQIEGTYYDSVRKVKVAHAEPLAGGAECVTCHVLNLGVVSATTVGMSPCLRCHDGTIAKAECSVCHVGDPSQAIRPDTALAEMATAQVPNPQCGGCHKDMKTCDACHGISMPHPDGFKAYLHARPAAIAIWDGNLKMCRKCHYPGHNDCQQSGCHMGQLPSHPSPAWKRLHGYASWAVPSTTCGCHNWNPYDHNGVTFCELCHATKPKAARP